MSDFIDDMAAFHAHEMMRDGEAASERRWLRWCDAVQRLAGLDSLDGDEASGRDTYSLDGAYDAYRAGKSPEAYAKAIYR